MRHREKAGEFNMYPCDVLLEVLKFAPNAKEQLDGMRKG
jgi:hypothetical protein